MSKIKFTGCLLDNGETTEGVCRICQLAGKYTDPHSLRGEFLAGLETGTKLRVTHYSGKTFTTEYHPPYVPSNKVEFYGARLLKQFAGLSFDFDRNEYLELWRVGVYPTVEVQHV